MVVVWRVTEQCNLACGFCGFDRTLNRVRVETSVESLRRFGAVLRDWSLASGESVLVSWIGGEPLGRDDLRAVSRHFREDLGLRVSTTTNGTTLGSAAVRSHLLDHYAELTVSVDGVGPLHDRLRGWRGGFENLSLSVPILAREAREREAPLRLRANVVLMRDNLEQFEDLCSILGDWGVVEITFNQLGGADRPEFFPEHRLREAEVDRLRVIIPRVRDSLARREVRLLGGAAYLERFAATARDDHHFVTDCRPGESFLFIDERGRVAPCSFTPGLIGVPIEELDCAEAMMNLSQRFGQSRARAGSVCGNCQSTQACQKYAA
ncbi:MAG: radical SAM protein [Candidatus Eisenbacteria bacterium]|nr:radical SAM protein [Candidatus Eisenbacteria bacterium]